MGKTKDLNREIVNIPSLISDYYTLKPNIDDKTNKVAFGTSGHRGSSKKNKKQFQ